MLGSWYDRKVAVQKARQAGTGLRQLLRNKVVVVVLVLLGMSVSVAAFTPWVFLLKQGQVEVTQWDRYKGKTEVTVGPEAKGWVPLKRMSRHALHAVIVAEDARFYEHHGLDFREIWNSLLTNIEKERYARGGSTITQQLVKLVFLEREKSLLRKAREAAGALLLEVIMSKEEILEWYLNVVDFGDGVYGIKKGAAHYFDTSPELLTVVQAVHMAIVLPSPNRWSQGLRRGNLTKFGQKRFVRIVSGLRRDGYITQNQWQQAMATGNFGSPLQAEASR